MEIDPILKQRLIDANQAHILDFWSTLDDQQRQILLHDINEVDFDRVRKAYDGIKQELLADSTLSDQDNKTQAKEENIDDIMEPVPADITGSINEANEEQLNNYRQKD